MTDNFSSTYWFSKLYCGEKWTYLTEWPKRKSSISDEKGKALMQY